MNALARAARVAWIGWGDWAKWTICAGCDEMRHCRARGGSSPYVCLDCFDQGVR